MSEMASSLIKGILARGRNLREHVSPSIVAALVICAVLEMLSRSLPPVLQNEQWAENPLTPHVVTVFNALLMVGLAGVGVCIVFIVVGVVRWFFRRG